MTEDIINLRECSYNCALVKDLVNRYSENHPLGISEYLAQFPVGISHQFQQKIARLSYVLNEALIKVVSAYFYDERIRAVYQFDKELDDILKVASEKPYKVGLYRPDFVFDVNGQARICEIGARYPVNGWMISYYLYLALSEPGAIDSQRFETVSSIDGILDELSGQFDNSLPLIMVHKNEKGTEIFNLFSEFRKNGLETLIALPSDLKAENGILTLNGLPVSQFIFEMDREELRYFSPEVLNIIIRDCNYLNDVRTLILVHDKRILAVLYDQDIMSGLLPADDYAFLRNFLIPTFSLGSAEKKAEIIQSPLKWILKQNSGGRGIGIYLSDNYTKEEWTNIIENNWQEYMAQQYVDQIPFTFPEHKIDDAINMVGVFFGFNGHSFGPGAFRGSSDAIVNIHQGKGLSYPLLVPRQ